MKTSNDGVFGALARGGLIALAIHALAAVAFAGIVYWMTSDITAISESYRREVQGNSEDIGLALQDAFWALWLWEVAMLAASLLATIIFLSMTQRLRPEFDEEESSCRGTWSALLLGVLAIGTLFLWNDLLNGEQAITMLLIPANYIGAIAAGFCTTVASFWLTTGLRTKTVMKASVPLAVPLAAMLPRFRK